MSAICLYSIHMYIKAYTNLLIYFGENLIISSWLVRPTYTVDSKQVPGESNILLLN